ncbi:YGL114W [Zygosaccharomyces parabailii]|nr:YGL114W [Zygosaccharomyces parabailii]
MTNHNLQQVNKENKTSSCATRLIPIRSSMSETQVPVSWGKKPGIQQMTMRATVVGLVIGSLVLISNFQFGLQTGWVSMMSLPSALLACWFFKQVWPLIRPHDVPFTDVETVYVQSMAVAVGTGPLAFGFVGVIPAIEKFLTKEESGNSRNQGELFSIGQLLMWSTGLAFFGIFIAVPLRKQVIVREKLPFPSGSATATLIAVLNGSEILQEVSRSDVLQMRNRRLSESSPADREISSLSRGGSPDDRYSSLEMDDTVEGQQDVATYDENIGILFRTFVVSSLYTIGSYFLPVLRSIPLFGTYLSKNYLWEFQPSPAYIGQGIIMGLPTVSYMLFGCMLGWGILAPLARRAGWVPPDAGVDDWEKGVHGWILWSSLSIMVVDSVVGFIVVTMRSIVRFWLTDDKARLLTNVWDDSYESMLLEEERVINKRRYTTSSSSNRPNTVKLVYDDVDHEVAEEHLVTYTTVLSGIIVSSLLCIILVIYLFGLEIIPIYAMVTALLIALFLSVLGIRALGETDLNPVSGIGKISQLIFALIVPRSRKGAVLLNLVAGGVAESGAQQAGDLMQDLKTGHLLGASPRAQFVAQIVGAIWSIVLSSVMYICYNKVYHIPDKQFRIPTAIVWIDCARLVTGQGLPEKALECSIILGCAFALLSLVRNCYRDRNRKWLVYVPSGVAVGVGIYNTPSFTIARFIGGVVASLWMNSQHFNLGAKTKMIVFSSGLVLGEGICSIFNMLFTDLNIPHL